MIIQPLYPSNSIPFGGKAIGQWSTWSRRGNGRGGSVKTLPSGLRKDDDGYWYDDTTYSSNAGSRKNPARIKEFLYRYKAVHNKNMEVTGYRKEIKTRLLDP